MGPDTYELEHSRRMGEADLPKGVNFREGHWAPLCDNAHRGPESWCVVVSGEEGVHGYVLFDPRNIFCNIWAIMLESRNSTWRYTAVASQERWKDLVTLITVVWTQPVAAYLFAQTMESTCLSLSAPGPRTSWYWSYILRKCEDHCDTLKATEILKQKRVHGHFSLHNH